jgi:hypothetical protein
VSPIREQQQPDQEPIDAPVGLRPIPPAYSATRAVMHALAEQTISPARQAVTGRIGLRATLGGFGTPLFGDQQQVRVDGTALVRFEHGAETSRETIDVDPGAASVLADWYAFGASILLELRAAAGAHAEPSLIQLWPEHFDIAVELGSEAAGARANYGFSPGDDDHPEPYAYVAPWVAPEPGELWRASGFAGAELGYAELLAAAEPRAAALAFMQERLAMLATP